MLFNSWEFLLLCLASIGLYYLPVPGSARKIWQITLLLAASAIFYAWENPKLLILLSASCLFNAIAVERILYWKSRKDSFNRLVSSENSFNARSSGSRGNHSNERSNSSVATVAHKPTLTDHPYKAQPSDPSQHRAKQWLIVTVAINLAFLAFFKYAGFLLSLLPHGFIAEPALIWLKSIPLPVGISFYTFQGISLVVDVWRSDISHHTATCLAGRGRARITSIRDVSFYVAFFPQLVAGPIVKAHEFVDQIEGKQFSGIHWLTVRRSLVVGYFLKIFVADNLAEQTASLSLGAAQLESSGPFNLIPLLYGYSLQIFADFAGYSLIAIGLGALFGYKLPQNFNFPYLSRSITEFWRRWHLSLSSWLRDYLYFPLGGNRKGAGRTYFNLFLVMFLGGLWHGAAWKFALWGSLHGLFLAFERLAGSVFRPGKVSVDTKQSNHSNAAIAFCASPLSKHRIIGTVKHLFQWFFTFQIVTLLWLTFLMPDMASIIGFFKGVFNGNTNFSGPPIFSLWFYGTTIIIYHIWGWLQEHKKCIAIKLSNSPLEPILHGLMIFLIVTNPGAPRGFIYFQF